MNGFLITGLVFLTVFLGIYLLKKIVKSLDEPNKHKWFR